MHELLPAFAAGELSADQRAELLEALRHSPQLRHELERQQQLRLLLLAAAALELSPPADLSARIARQVALRHYLQTAFDLLGDLLSTYGRAAAFYTGLG